MACSPRASPAVGAMFGTPESCRKVSGLVVKSLHRDEQAAFANMQLPQPFLPGYTCSSRTTSTTSSSARPSSEVTNCEYNRKQRDEPTVEAVWAAVYNPPPQSPRLVSQPPPRQGNILKSPRRADALGQTMHHASPWQNDGQFTLQTPYPMATDESRFADAIADKAALAAVAFSAGMGTAAPPAGMSTNRRNTRDDLPSMRGAMMNGQP